MAIYVCGNGGCTARGVEVEAPPPKEFRQAGQRLTCTTCKKVMTYRGAGSKK